MWDIQVEGEECSGRRWPAGAGERGGAGQGHWLVAAAVAGVHWLESGASGVGGRDRECGECLVTCSARAIASACTVSLCELLLCFGESM